MRGLVWLILIIMLFSIIFLGGKAEEYIDNTDTWCSQSVKKTENNRIELQEIYVDSITGKMYLVK